MVVEDELRDAHWLEGALRLITLVIPFFPSTDGVLHEGPHSTLWPSNAAIDNVVAVLVGVDLQTHDLVG